MQRLVNKMVELIELARDMTPEQYENWKVKTLQQCSGQVHVALRGIFEIIEGRN